MLHGWGRAQLLVQRLKEVKAPAVTFVEGLRLAGQGGGHGGITSWQGLADDRIPRGCGGHLYVLVHRRHQDIRWVRSCHLKSDTSITSPLQMASEEGSWPCKRTDKVPKSCRGSQGPRQLRIKAHSPWLRGISATSSELGDQGCLSLRCCL